MVVFSAHEVLRQTKAASGQTKVFLYVNNRFEGNAPETLAAMVEQSESPA